MRSISSLSLTSLALLAARGSTALVLNPLDTAVEVFDSLVGYKHSHLASAGRYLEVDEAYYHAESGKERKLCTLHPVPEDEGFDDDNFHAAVKECGEGGIISLPDAN